VQAQQEIRNDGVVADPLAVSALQPWKIIAAALAVEAHGLGAAFEAHRAADIRLLRLFVIGAQVIGELVEQRMQHRTMQAFVVIQNDELPVALHVVGDALHQAQLLHAPRAKFLR
jgi:hypothetical protein